MKQRSQERDDAERCQLHRCVPPSLTASALMPLCSVVQISNLAKLVKLDKQHTAKIKSDTNEFAETLKQRILFLESQSRAQFDKLEDHMTRLDTMYSAFPADAAAISQIGGAQPQGLPGFIATYIHSLFTQHTQSTAASLTQQAQTHQIHLQNWVQEYIKVSIAITLSPLCLAALCIITTTRTHVECMCLAFIWYSSEHASLVQVAGRSEQLQVGVAHYECEAKR